MSLALRRSSWALVWECICRAALFCFVALLCAQPLQAQPLADPRVDWFSADSAHFRVHYRHGQRQQALAVAQAAERVYPRVTQALQWQPRTRPEIVVYSEFDIANGFSTPLPFNLMGVFLTPPDGGELLDNSGWLDLLLVHEFTHAVHLDKVRGVPGVLQNIFGNVPWFIPNVFQPSWMLEGLAVWNESEPNAGRGRLRGPWFEAWLRSERQRGFVSLAELNADGRSLPVNKQYLYGAYFMDFLARRYGPDKIQALVHQYSGNIVPRLHSAPYAATGKMMDELWLEFLADLTQQVDARSQAIVGQAAVVGTALTPPLFDIDSVAALPTGGAWLAVLQDGLNGAHLVRVSADGRQQIVQRVNRGARVDVAADGTVLLTQPDLCNTLYYSYDLYRLQGNTLEQLSQCAHLRRAVKAGSSLVALQLDAGKSRLVQWLQASALSMSQPPRVLLDPEAGTELVDLAAAPDGQRVTVLTRRGADWRLLEVDLGATAGTAPRLLLSRNAPMQSLRHGAAGLEFVMAEGGAPNVWRLQGGQLQRLTHSHTAVLTHAGTAADGSLVSVGIAPQGYVLQRLAPVVALQDLAVSSLVASPATAAEAQIPAASAGLGDGRPYSALKSLYPRAWLPAISVDRGLSALGASTSGADALGWHQYTALVQFETSQRELLGSLEYMFVGSHGVAIKRQLTAQAWNTVGTKETTSVFDRSTTLQWLSQFPFSRLERRVVLGVGAATHWIDRVNLPASTTTRRRDERLLAALVDVDLSNSDWASEGRNRGWHGSVLVESYKPLSGGDALRFDGTVVRGDLRGYVPLGRSVLALRATEARAQDRTEPFQLGGASDDVLQMGPTLNNRQLALRGYSGDEIALIGRNARVVSLEWRTPLADIDRHAMVPAVGINRLSAAVFFDAGGTWNSGQGPDRWRRGVGVELLGEVKLLYAFGLQLRLGLAQGLDVPKDTRGYLTAGRSF